jgi:hypothetical protein
MRGDRGVIRPRSGPIGGRSGPIAALLDWTYRVERAACGDGPDEARAWPATSATGRALEAARMGAMVAGPGAGARMVATRSAEDAVVVAGIVRAVLPPHLARLVEMHAMVGTEPPEPILPPCRVELDGCAVPSIWQGTERGWPARMSVDAVGPRGRGRPRAALSLVQPVVVLDPPSRAAQLVAARREWLAALEEIRCAVAALRPPLRSWTLVGGAASEGGTHRTPSPPVTPDARAVRGEPVPPPAGATIFPKK